MKAATSKAPFLFGSRPLSVMTPSMRVAGVTSKHGFHTCQEQTQDKPNDKTNAKNVFKSVCQGCCCAKVLVLHACMHYLVTSLDLQRCSQRLPP